MNFCISKIIELIIKKIYVNKKGEYFSATLRFRL